MIRGCLCFFNGSSILALTMRERERERERDIDERERGSMGVFISSVGNVRHV
jgi:hypothetical protein